MCTWPAFSADFLCSALSPTSSCDLWRLSRQLNCIRLWGIGNATGLALRRARHSQEGVTEAGPHKDLISIASSENPCQSGDGLPSIRRAKIWWPAGQSFVFHSLGVGINEELANTNWYEWADNEVRLFSKGFSISLCSYRKSLLRENLTIEANDDLASKSAHEEDVTTFLDEHVSVNVIIL